MRSVRISLRTARLALDSIERALEQGFDGSFVRPALAELTQAMKPKRSLAPARKRKAAKRATKKDETAAVRDLVMRRADGQCEACEFNARGAGLSLELDHFWGRGKARQTVENCWALCRTCHRRKTDNVPTRSFWLAAFGVHCRQSGYESEGRRANQRIEAGLNIAAAAALSRGPMLADGSS